MTAPSPALVPARLPTELTRALCREVAGPNRAFVRRPLSALRAARLRAGDPPIAFDLDGTELIVPLSHLLPVHRAAHPTYSRNLGDVVAAVAEARPGATLVDIGANVGDSVAIVRAQSSVPVLCIEGDEIFLPYLRQNLDGVTDVEIVECYVATTADATRRSVVERVGGTARLVERADGELNHTCSLTEVLAAHPAFATPTVIKIDTDGHDASILRTAEDVLGAAHPVLFFEHDPAMASAVGAPDPASIFELLVGHGYDTFVLYDNKGPRLEVLHGRDLERLVARSRALDASSDLPYLDVCAVHGDDADLAGAVLART